MDGVTASAIIGPILAAVGLLIAYEKMWRLKAKLSIEVVACQHSLGSDGCAFLLWMDYRVHNSGNKNTTITGLEAHFVDAQYNLQSQTLTLNIGVGAGASTNPPRTLFSFVPPFPFAQNIEVHFILYHTFGREVFAADSVQSDLQMQL